MHWLTKHDNQRATNEPAVLVHWWRAIFPLVRTAVSEGDQSEASEVFWQLYNDDYVNVVPVEDLLALVESLCERLGQIIEDASSNAEGSNQQRQRWQHIADPVAQGIDAAHRAGRLNSPALVERAYSLLTSLANGREASRLAARILQRF
jgi:hypothetical protein